MEILHGLGSCRECLETQEDLVKEGIFMLLSISWSVTYSYTRQHFKHLPPFNVHGTFEQADNFSHAALLDEILNPAHSLVP
jgi:hypothetical protein